MQMVALNLKRAQDPSTNLNLVVQDIRQTSPALYHFIVHFSQYLARQAESHVNPHRMSGNPQTLRLFANRMLAGPAFSSYRGLVTFYGSNILNAAQVQDLSGLLSSDVETPEAQLEGVVDGFMTKGGLFQKLSVTKADVANALRAYMNRYSQNIKPILAELGYQPSQNTIANPVTKNSQLPFSETSIREYNFSTTLIPAVNSLDTVLSQYANSYASNFSQTRITKKV